MKIKRLIWVIVTLILLITIGGLVLKSVDSKFTTERWLNNPDDRYKMIEDIEKNHNLVGKTEQDVEGLLGQPDTVWNLESDDNVEHEYFANVYYIGTEKNGFSLMTEPDIYVVSFEDGVVIATSVQPT